MIEGNSDNFKEEVLEAETVVLVDFNAEWCGPCQMMGPVVAEIAEENSEIKVVSVNIDDARELAREYKVMSIPCLVVFKDGAEVRRMVGVNSKQKILEMIKEADGR
ncbi:MAG: thioredoxin [Candidatus Saccharibacteria bacterium]|nr:thioredoxin [Candidatus Saccharibacteria bacterium]